MYCKIGPGNAANPNVGGFASDHYWSSSEINVSNAWYQYFGDGDQSGDNKNNTYRVRAVRAF